MEGEGGVDRKSVWFFSKHQSSKSTFQQKGSWQQTTFPLHIQVPYLQYQSWPFLCRGGDTQKNIESKFSH